MAMEKNSFTDPGPCCQKIEDMMDYARKIIQKWPPLHRYTLGEMIINETLTMLRLATKARLRYMNKSTLADLDTSKAVLDAFLRQANKTVFRDRNGNERRLLTDHSYGVWCGYTEEIGRLIGGWINSVSGRRNGNKGNVP
jgi:hypothetical protein